MDARLKYVNKPDLELFLIHFGVFFFLFGPREYHQAIELVESEIKIDNFLKVPVFWVS